MATQKVFKIALPTYNAQTDGDPNHFSLFVDQLVDYILIKEKLVATVSVSNSTTLDIAHGLSYVPFCLVFAELSAGVWRKLFSASIEGNGCSFAVNSTNLRLSNFSGGAKNFVYHIFYDNVT